MIAEAVVGNVYMREYEAAFVNLYSHLLAECATHEQTVEETARARQTFEVREVYILKYVPFDALIVGEYFL